MKEMIVSPETEVVLSRGGQRFGSGGYYCRWNHISGPAPVKVRDGKYSSTDFVYRLDEVFTLPDGCVVEQREGDIVGSGLKGRTFQSVRYISHSLSPKNSRLK